LLRAAALDLGPDYCDNARRKEQAKIMNLLS
jgi:hypothetical protein